MPRALRLFSIRNSQSEIRNYFPMPYAFTYSLLHAAGCSLPAAGFFLSQSLNMAQAQPTPGRTVKASTGQFMAQAPHSMQPSLSRISTTPPLKTNTA
jgi:hypothetical protein